MSKAQELKALAYSCVGMGEAKAALHAAIDAQQSIIDEQRTELERLTTPAPVCPVCGSTCNERDELVKAEREIERLAAESGRAVEVERARCLRILTKYQVPVGNSSAGELAAEWTLDALREVRAAIAAGSKTELKGGV
jgi:hypothetical protein